MSRLRAFPFAIVFCATILAAGPAFAYIGPGAGVSIFGALFGLVSIIALAFWSLLKWGTALVFRPSRARRSNTSGPVPAAAGAIEQDTAPRTARAPATVTSRLPLLIALFIALSGWFEWPRGLVRDGVGAAVHVAEGIAGNTWHTSPARFAPEERGVVVHDRTKAYPGYNLEVSATAHEARLLDMEGREVHRWSLDPGAISRAWAADGRPMHDLSALYWRRVKAMPDGSLLVLFENSRTTPYASGMVKLDWNSNLVWTAPRRYHHSLDIGPDGRIYTLFQYVERTPPEFAPWTETPFLNEGIAVLGPDGRERDRINILQALARSPYRSVLKLLANPLRPDDPLHLNAVTCLDADNAAKLPFAREGDLLVSIRNLHTVAIVDPETRKVTWAASNLWFMQHEPVFTDSGTLLVFDNLGGRGGTSRAVEWSPRTGEFEWIYRGNADMPLKSAKYAAIAHLPNGNRLITSGYGGRAIEVTPDSETVWEWRTDRRHGPDGERVGNLMEMTRLPAGFFRQEISGLLDGEGKSS